MKAELKRLLKFLKKINIMHAIAILILIVSALLFILHFEAGRMRLYYAGKDLATSFANWAIEIFELPFEVEPTVANLSTVDVSSLPFDIDAIRDKVLSMGMYFVNADMFVAYNQQVAYWLYNALLIISVLLPVIVMLSLMLSELLYSKNEKKVGYISKPLCVLLKVERITIYPVKKAIVKFRNFIVAHKYYYVIFVTIWVLNTNLITIITEFLAFYYWILVDATVSGILIQFVKLLVDILLAWFSLPVPIWIMLYLLVFDKLRKVNGYKELNHQEAKNCGFLKETGFISIVVGAPGVGKTAFISDSALSWVNIFKEESKQLLIDDMLTFPEFTFLAFEHEITKKIWNNEIYNTSTAERYADELYKNFENTLDKNVLFGYDYDRFGLSKNLGNRIETLENTLKEHAKAYFIYLCTNVNMSNFPIRFDGQFDDSEYFPIWKNDYFTITPEESQKRSVYSHILDQDMMRMGKTVEKFNPRAGTFGFGVYTNTEWGKSRGNNLTLQGVDKEAKEANQKNDLYEYAHKMCRHASTMVRGKVFFRFLGDEQRPRTLGVDLRDLGSVLTIESKSDIRLVMPHFVIGEMIYKIIYTPMLKQYLRWINLHGDETLFSYLILKKPLSWLSNYYRKIYNIFGTYDLGIKKEAGTSYGDTPEQSEPEHFRYYLMPKKIYSDRYNSDCYEGFFSKRQIDSLEGINDLPTYDGLNMDINEMQEQHDYFLMQLMRVFSNEAESAGTAKRNVKTDLTEPEEEIQFTEL